MTVWAVLTDPEAMDPHLPGTAKVKVAGDLAYRVSMKISMGFLRPMVKASVQLSDVVKLEAFNISLNGKSIGAGVDGSASVEICTTSDNVGTTRVVMSGNVNTTGLLKKVKDDKIENAAKGFLESYFSSVEQAASTQ